MNHDPNSMFALPIAEAFLKTHDQSNDIIQTYDYTLDNLKYVIGKDHPFNIEMGSNTTVDCSFTNVRIYTPLDPEIMDYCPSMPKLPLDAIQGRETYSALFIADLVMGDTKMAMKNYLTFKIPIPIGSKYSGYNRLNLDNLKKAGEDFSEFKGCFIIGGNLKTLLPCYKKPFNHPIVLKNMYKDQISRAEALYSKEMDYDDSFYLASCMIAATNDYIAEDFICSLQLSNPNLKDKVEKTSYSVINTLPYRYLFFAFGCKSDAEILRYIDPTGEDYKLMDAFINAVLYGKAHCEFASRHDISNMNQVKALKVIADEIMLPSLSDEAKMDATIYLLNNEFMPGIGSINTHTSRNKAVCREMGATIRGLYKVGMGLEKSGEKAALPNRRVLSGNQMIKDFKSFYRVAIRNLLSRINQVRNVTGVVETIANHSKILSNNISSSMYKVFNSICGLTGRINQKTRTEVLQMRNYPHIKSKLRQLVITQTMTDTAMAVPWCHRTVLCNDMYFICPSQSPEAGKQVGLYRDPTIYSFISIPIETRYYKDILINHIKDYKYDDMSTDYMATVKVNGSILCWIKDVNECFNALLKMRETVKYVDDNNIKHGLHTISIVKYPLSVEIWSDIGRLMALFINVTKTFKNGTFDPEFIKWCFALHDDVALFNEGFEHGWIEYLDSEMVEQNCVVAYNLDQYMKSPKYFTHMALPGGCHSCITNIVPGMNFNPIVRQLLITCHVRQEIGRACRYPMLTNTAMLELVNLQRPVIRSTLFDMFNLTNYPITNNCIIAFMHYGYNQEDSVIINRASIDRGFLRIVAYQKENFITVNSEEQFYKPTGSSKLTNKGVPKDVSIPFEYGDDILGICKVFGSKSANISIKNHVQSGNYIDDRRLRSCCLTQWNDRLNQLQQNIMYAEFMNPHTGDKLTPETGQKCTIGKIYDESEMPFNINGLRPDIIFDPYSILKRVTLSHLMQTRWATLCTLLCTQGDWTPYFNGLCDDEIDAMYKKIGIDPTGKTIMFNPETGEQIESPIYMGISIYGRQPHIVEKKFIIRDNDKVNNWGLPDKGKKYGGAQSIDVMTSDAESAAGINGIIKDFRLNQGCNVPGGFCDNCHSFGVYQANSGTFICPTCGPTSTAHISRVTPAAHYLEQILESLGFQLEVFENRT